MATNLITYTLIHIHTLSNIITHEAIASKDAKSRLQQLRDNNYLLLKKNSHGLIWEAASHPNQVKVTVVIVNSRPPICSAPMYMYMYKR